MEAPKVSPDSQREQERNNVCDPRRHTRTLSALPQSTSSEQSLKNRNRKDKGSVQKSQRRQKGAETVKSKIPILSVLAILAILGITYLTDLELFRGLLGWTLGGTIVLLLNAAFFGKIVESVMKSKDIQDLVRLFRDAKTYLEKILQNQKHKDQH